MNLETSLKKIDEWIETDEGKKRLEDYFENIRQKQKIVESQLIRFKEKYDNRFEEIIEKIISKYDSDAYVDRERKKGREPRESLYWFLFKYTEKYGREATKKEWKKYTNTFTSCMYFYKEYYFSRMDGQGSVIQIYKK